MKPSAASWTVMFRLEMSRFRTSLYSELVASTPESFGRAMSNLVSGLGASGGRRVLRAWLVGRLCSVGCNAIAESSKRTDKSCDGELHGAVINAGAGLFKQGRRKGEREWCVAGMI
jgi:hypothetical protein